jgi:CRP/FNR family transcriptional regulator, anaerobic regulatory protein
VPTQLLNQRPSCPPYELNLCHAIASAGDDVSDDFSAMLEATEHTVPARRIAFRSRDLHDIVPIMCEGWAASAIALSDGSRQILSFLLPGDLVSATLLFGAPLHCMVEAITDVRYRTFRRADFKAALFKHPNLFEKISKSWIEEKSRSDQLAIDLGRRTADERIARLILGLKERLEQRGMANGLSFEFPLRQHHIADATGLTPVHVSKVLSEFRRNGLIEISDRAVTIRDLENFQRIATLR